MPGCILSTSRLAKLPDNIFELVYAQPFTYNDCITNIANKKTFAG